MSSQAEGSMSHSPLPWKVTNEPNWDHIDSHCGIDGADGLTVCDIYNSLGHDTTEGDRATADANAALIVRAVNCHEELLAALKLARHWLAQTYSEKGPAMAEVNAAIAKAEATHV